MNSWLQKQVNERPNHPAFYWKMECWSFLEVAQEVQHWITAFRLNIPPLTKRIALFSRNSKELYFSILALWELGKEIVFLNTYLSSSELTYQLNDANVTHVLVGEDFLNDPTILNIDQVKLLAMSCLVKEGTTIFTAPSAYQPTATASIMYTSGTTGKPKGVVQCFENHLASALATQENMTINENDCWLCPVPLFHISGLSIMMRHLVLGCSIRLYERFDAVAVTKDLSQGKGTIISVVAFMLCALLDHYPKDGYSTKCRGILLGGGPIAKKILATCKWLNLPVIQSYGMTETCSQVVALTLEDASKKIGSAGKPLTGISVKIVTNDQQKLEPEQVGEILLKGKNIIQRYLNETQRKTSNWTKDGWFKTGDMGYVDEEGYLYLVSRLNELIISGGENIYPTEIEQVLNDMPAIKEVAVIGEPDDTWGAVPVAYVVGQSTLTTEKVQQFTRRYLAKFKLPKKIYLCNSLPKTVNGKLAKHRLRTVEREEFLRE